jgi:tetratricopeptide (TPR) repeat protein
MGMTEAALGQETEALQLYENLVARWPQDPRGYIGASRALVALGRRDVAARLLQRATLAVPSGDARGHTLLAREYGDRMEFALALREAQTAHSADPGDAEAGVELGRRLLNTGRLAEARVLLDEILRAHPESDAARRVLAAVLINPLAAERDPARAEQLLLEVVQQTRSDVDSLQALGELYMDGARYRPAAYVYTLALAVRSDLTPARVRLAQAYAHIGDASESARQAAIGRQLVLRDQEERRLKAAVGQHPRDPDPHLVLGRHYERVGRYRSALPEFDAAYSLAGGSGPARAALLDLDHRAGMIPSGVGDARKP